MFSSLQTKTVFPHRITKSSEFNVDPNFMDDHIEGREHFLKILEDRKRSNSCVVSSDDLGESKPVFSDTTDPFAGSSKCFQLSRGYLDGFNDPFEVALEGPVQRSLLSVKTIKTVSRSLQASALSLSSLMIPLTSLAGNNRGSCTFAQTSLMSRKSTRDDRGALRTPDFSLSFEWDATDEIAGDRSTLRVASSHRCEPAMYSNIGPRKDSVVVRLLSCCGGIFRWGRKRI